MMPLPVALYLAALGLTVGSIIGFFVGLKVNRGEWSAGYRKGLEAGRRNPLGLP